MRKSAPLGVTLISKACDLSVLSLLLPRKRYCKRSLRPSGLQGFTLIELLVVIAILAILATIGTIVFRGVTSSARDSSRKGDVDAIAKAMEIQFVSSGSYQQPQDINFASGKKPKLPQGGDYTVLISANNNSFRVCAPLEKNTAPTCGASNSDYCFCVSSSQGSFEAGGGGSSGGYLGHPTSCDPSQSLGVGLVGYWNFDGEAGSVLSDRSGSGNNGAWSGAGSHWVASKSGLGNAGNFSNGNNVSITDAPSLRPTNALSLVFWVNPGDNGVLHDILGKALFNNPTAWAFGFRRNASGIFSDAYINGLRYTKFESSPLPAGTWGHYTLTYDGTTIATYKNGSLISGTLANGTIDSTTGAPFKIGMGGGYPDFIGLLDEVRIYNRVLSVNEINALYNNGNGCVP